MGHLKRMNLFAREGRALSAPIRDGTVPCDKAVAFEQAPYKSADLIDTLAPFEHANNVEDTSLMNPVILWGICTWQRVASGWINAKAMAAWGGCLTLSRSDSLTLKSRCACPALSWYDMEEPGGSEDTPVSLPSFCLVPNPDLGPRGFLLPPAPPLRSPPLPPRLASPACLPGCVGGSVGSGGCPLFPSWGHARILARGDDG